MKIIFGLSLLWAYWNLLLLWSHPPQIATVEEPRLDWAEGAFISLVGLTAFLGVSVICLALSGYYSLLTLVLALNGFSILLVICNRQKKFPRFLPGGIYEVGLVLLLACCAPLYFQPHEYILGWADAGTYMNIGVNLARTGHWVVQDDFSGWLGQFAPNAYYQVPKNIPDQMQFFGWYNHPVFKDQIFPQFFPLHPCILSIGVLIAGIWGGLYVTPLWGLLGVAAVYLAVRRLFNRPTAILAALLLALTPTQIFFSRYPTAEPLTLLFLFTGLLAHHHLQEGDRSPRLWALWAAGAFGCALLTRIDLPLLVLVVFLHLGIIKSGNRWNRNWTIFLWILAAFLLGAVLFGYFWGWMYIANTYGFILRNAPRSAAIASGFAILAVLGIAYVMLPAGHRPFSKSKTGLLSIDHLKGTAAILVLILSFYAYFIRPEAPLPTAENHGLFDWNSLNWVRLGWYLTPLGLLLSTWGLFMIIRKADLDRLGLFLSLGILTTFQYIHNSQITPYHIYAMRRYVPLVIPVLIIFAAYGLYDFYRRSRPLKWRALVIAVGLSLGLGLVYQSRHLFFLRDFKGVVDSLTQFSQRMVPGSVILINDHEFGDRFGVPLKYSFGFDVATLRQDNQNALPYLEQLVQRAKRSRQKIYLLAVNPLSETVKRQLTYQPLFLHPLLIKMLRNTFIGYPKTIEESFYGIETYEIIGLVRDTQPLLRQPRHLDMDLGGFDAGYIQSGFFEKEFIPRFPTMRWTEGTSVLEFPNPVAQRLRIAVQAMTLLSVKYPSPRVALFLDGHSIGHFYPTRNWETYRFTGPSEPRNGRTVLTFVSETFNPKAIGLNQDTRDLGFLLDRVTIDFSR
ncbi:MAG: glycosyltransferase family 39 protein [Deltaproteobacteria bacterium]|nr:glycosyltransferase family 39 protein [Deltaproteobacteria bacterium]